MIHFQTCPSETGLSFLDRLETCCSSLSFIMVIRPNSYVCRCHSAVLATIIALLSTDEEGDATGVCGSASAGSQCAFHQRNDNGIDSRDALIARQSNVT